MGGGVGFGEGQPGDCARGARGRRGAGGGAGGGGGGLPGTRPPASTGGARDASRFGAVGAGGGAGGASGGTADGDPAAPACAPVAGVAPAPSWAAANLDALPVTIGVNPPVGLTGLATRVWLQDAVLATTWTQTGVAGVAADCTLTPPPVVAFTARATHIHVDYGDNPRHRRHGRSAYRVALPAPRPGASGASGGGYPVGVAVDAPTNAGWDDTLGQAWLVEHAYQTKSPDHAVAVALEWTAPGLGTTVVPVGEVAHPVVEIVSALGG